MKTTIAVVCLLCLGSLVGGQTLDQSYIPGTPPQFHAYVSAFQEAAQTFTVGVSGTLHTVDVLISRHPSTSQPLVLDITPLSGGVPDLANSLGTAQLGPSVIPTTPAWRGINVSSQAINVSAGQTLAIVLRSPGSSTPFEWHGDNVAPYGGGTAFIGSNVTFPAGWTPVPAYDMGFRTHVSGQPASCPAFGLSANLNSRFHVYISDPTGPDLLIPNDNVWLHGPVSGAVMRADLNGSSVTEIEFSVVTSQFTVSGKAIDRPHFSGGRQLLLTDCVALRTSGSAPLRICVASSLLPTLGNGYAQAFVSGVGVGPGHIGCDVTARLVHWLGPVGMPLTASGVAPPSPPAPVFYRPFQGTSSVGTVAAGTINRLQMQVDIDVASNGSYLWLPLSAKLTVGPEPWPQATLFAYGTPAPGGTVSFDVVSPNDALRPYHVLLSVGRGPFQIGSRFIELDFDALVLWSLAQSGLGGTLGPEGYGYASLDLPPDPALSGLTVYGASVVLDPLAPAGISEISNGVAFQIQ